MRYENTNAIPSAICPPTVPSPRPLLLLRVRRSVRSALVRAASGFGRVWGCLVRIGEDVYLRKGLSGAVGFVVSFAEGESLREATRRPTAERPLPSFARAMMPPRIEGPSTAR